MAQDPLDAAFDQIQSIRTELGNTRIDAGRILERVKAVEADIVEAKADAARNEGRIEEAHRLIAVLAEKVNPLFKITWAVVVAVIAATVGGIIAVVNGSGGKLP